MAKQNDFMEGFLRGLYNSGVGNPEVQRTNEQAQQTQNADFTSKMAGQGMMPNALPSDHPIAQKVGGFISQMFGGASSPKLTEANFKPDPNAFTMDTTGHLQRGGVGQTGNTVIPQDKAPTLLAEQYRQENKPRKDWVPISGQLSEKGTILQTNSAGDIRDSGIKASPTSGSNMATVRQQQNTMQDLPSNQPPTTAGGAAYQVKVGARQGKTLIAKAGSPQRTAAAAADLVRSITRVAPTDEGLKNANFSDNLVTRWSVLKQKLTADPQSVSNPKIRKEMFDIFDEMDKSAEPFIKNQLDTMKEHGFNVTDADYNRQMGKNYPDVKFEESSNPLLQGSDHPAVGQVFNGSKITKVEELP